MLPTGKKPKLVLYPTRKVALSLAGSSQDDFAVDASYRVISIGRFMGTLKVVRKPDELWSKVVFRGEAGI